ncbi:EpsG family protein, partial [Enterococcus faecium]|nr:EpsG family protein [Enterococcus faecium]
QFNLFDRISDFFLINLIVYLPNQLAKIKNTKKIIFYMYLFLAFFMLYYLTIIIFKPEWNKVYPYLFYWN